MEDVGNDKRTLHPFHRVPKLLTGHNLGRSGMRPYRLYHGERGVSYPCPPRNPWLPTSSTVSSPLVHR